MTEKTVHNAVMVEETMLVLDVKSGGHYLDGTLGGGTHTEELLKRSKPDGHVISLDVDRSALARATARFAAYGEHWNGIEANFRHLASVAEQENLALLDGILLDVGLSSDELENSSLGISFQKDGPLDMRLGPKSNDDGLTAAEVINSWTQQDLETVIRTFGEERYARRIAAQIVKARKSARIIRTLELVSVIRSVVPHTYEGGRIHFATRTFQALRIVVNDELQALKDAIRGAQTVLKPGGHLAILTFHSLEDRIVKLAFTGTEAWEPITKKPMMASEEETKENPRSRTAKLRAAIKK